MSLGHARMPGHASLGRICVPGHALLPFELWRKWWDRPTSLQSTGLPGLSCILFILAVLMFIRVNAMFAIVVNKFLTGVINCDCPCMQDALKHIVFVLGEALLFGLAVHLLERAVSFYFFFA